MPEFVSMLILAVVQGLTEFLPVSSSGHLVLMQHLLGAREGDVFFDVVLHIGTLGSVVMVYRRDVLRLLRLDRAALGYILALAIGTVPAVIVGLLAKDTIERVFASPAFAGAGLLVTAAVLLSTRAARPAPSDGRAWEPKLVAPWRALVIGTAQAFAILPGVSRSGSTIAASLWTGLERAEAARFSFLLSVPAILGALVLQLMDGGMTGVGGGAALQLLVAAAAAFGVGLLAIRWTALAVVQAHFWKFSGYCLVVGAAALLLLR
ncbi:MAG TPA: undecaprenyl-diphosphate phosphatase [Candidatus Krumholzibacteria bacterium]|nr:undecaprenyl-diphosphate phosphatase [Candidatus Krumholzibacteria bacterium]